MALDVRLRAWCDLPWKDIGLACSAGVIFLSLPRLGLNGLFFRDQHHCTGSAMVVHRVHGQRCTDDVVLRTVDEIAEQNR